MKITASTVSVTVTDVAASSAFLVKHFGFQQNMADEHGNFASLGREDVGMTIIFLRLGCEVLPESYRHQHAAGLILAFTTTGLDAEESRLRAEGVAITMPLREEPWGERLFQVADPNGVIIQLVEWVAAAQGEWSQPTA
ncbi:MAG: glyoxalase [Acaryochloris sp. RU_4_1]|nr:glyoxalase [Acaryochloris sp. RU_4_1]